MISKSALIFLCCCFTVAVSSPFYDQYQPLLEEQEPALAEDLVAQPQLELVRVARSPDGGNIDLVYKDTAAGRKAGIQYNHNLMSSDDGRYSLDAYAHANRNFDWNRNDYGGGIMGSFRF